MAEGENGNLLVIDTNPIEQEPEPTYDPDRDIFYTLFTQRNNLVGQRITNTAASIANSQWQSTALGTRFVIHGWQQSASSSLNGDIRRAWLQSNNHNVVVVDWSEGAGSLNYLTSRNRVGPTGQSIARFIDWLHQNGHLVNFNRLVIAGHSLGAQ